MKENRNLGEREGIGGETHARRVVEGGKERNSRKKALDEMRYGI